MFNRKAGLQALPGRLLMLFGVMMLHACAATRGGSVPYDRTDFTPPDKTTVAQAGDGRIGPLDVVTVSVAQLPDLSRDVQIDAGGVATLPLLGGLKAAGLTTKELAAVITQRLSTQYVRNPDVSVILKQSAAETITVEGSVQNPGVFPITGEMTLLKAVALARGTTETANPRRVVVFRMINGQRNAAAFDLQSIRRANAPDPRIYGNDIVVIDGSGSSSRFRDILTAVPLLSLFRPF